MAENPLHVGDRQSAVAGHPVGRRVTQIVQRPVRPQAAVGAHEHRPGRVIGQRTERPSQRPPQRIIRPGPHQPLHLGLIQPQPDKRIRGRWQLLQRPRALADHGDQLLPRIGVAAGDSEQFRRARPAGHPQRHQRPVPVRAQPGEQLIELLIRDLPGNALDDPGPVTAAALSTPRLHRIVMSQRPAMPPVPHQRERVHHRPAPGFQMELIKAAQHRFAMRDRGRGVLNPRCRLARDAVDAARAARRPTGLAGHLQPADEVPGLRPGGLIPADPGRPQEPEPAQQIHPIRALRRRRPPARLQVPQICGNRSDSCPVAVLQPVWLKRVARRLK